MGLEVRGRAPNLGFPGGLHRAGFEEARRWDLGGQAGKSSEGGEAGAGGEGRMLVNQKQAVQVTELSL